MAANVRPRTNIEKAQEAKEIIASKLEKAKKVKKEKKYRIIIDEQFGPDAQDDVFIGVNGKHYLIKRGHEVIVPEGVVNVLKEAIVTKIVKHEDGTEELRHIPRVAFRVLGEAKEENK